MQRGWIALTVVLVVLAGCSGGPGDRTPAPIEASASQATVTDDGLAGSGFSEVGVEQIRVNRSGTLSVSGDVEMDLGYQVFATGWRATYRSANGETVFALYTVPLAKPERVDARIDPLGDRSLADIVAEAQTSYTDPRNLEHVQNRTVTILDSESTVRQYAGTATADGEATEITVYVATVDHESDRIRAVAVTPGDADNRETLRTLFESVDH